ncbi:MAG: LysR family transcriptional regulator [Flavobacteriales bacterium]|nr:LysR family transcriptional regulator [Flavobacteriales bacterium]MCB9447294.1 LysR family transcriptional regulator [Flavobacteriales bacterium]
MGRNGAFLGEGRIALLKHIDACGSISKAAKAMKMSYLKAWKLVESMNQTSHGVLVVKAPGGKGGGGAQLTDAGRKIIALYEQLNARCERFLQKELENLLKENPI